MRLFKSNKSQASIDRLVVNSRDSSPTQSEAPAPFPAQAYSGAQQYDTTRPTHPSEQRQFQSNDFDQPQTHPAHILTRSLSHRQTTGPDAFANRPSVNVIPVSPNANTATIHEHQEPYPSPPQGQLQPVPPEKEHRKSKRSIFGLHSSKDKEVAAVQSAQKQVGRTSSVLRRVTVNPPVEQPQPHQQQSAPGQQYSVNTACNSAYLQNQENVHQGRDQFDQQDLDDPNTQYEQYYRPQSQYDSPQTPVSSHHSPEYAEDQPEYSPQQQQYQSFQAPRPENPDSYEAYHTYPQQQGSSSFEAYQPLRPPSQQSLGPPSPTVYPSQEADSRPSTATNQSRYSAQSLGAPQPQPQQGMPRSEPPNGGLRQQMGQQRDPRDEQNHAQYNNQQDPRTRMSQQAPEQGRASPAPRNRDDNSNLDYHQLLQKHEELQAKYSKVKRYYFEREAQVTQLQNTVANQRLSMSRTSLDDAQYATRFERLNGAINQLAFNIRKDWKMIPGWLKSYCNKDAHKIGTKEMTAVGRASISRWIYDMVFESYFHPAIEPILSSHLKSIEKNIRRAGQVTFMTDEQRDDLTTKITTWRLTTMEGLQDILANGQDRTAYLVKFLSESLTGSLKQLLVDPPPAGVESGVQMIIELAIGIMQNLPIESRDVCVEYYAPGTLINDAYMKMESGMTPLTNPGSHEDAEEDEAESNADTEGGSARDAQSIENEIREASAKATATRQGSGSDAGSAGLKADPSKGKKSSGFLGGLVSKKPAPPPTSSAGSGLTAKDVGGDRESMDENEGKIRFAAFFMVEVRGKGKDGGGNVLYRAPCYGYS